MTVGTLVVRKRDGAVGIIVKRELVVPLVAHPGHWGKTVVSIRLADDALRAAAGGDMAGDLSWARSNFKVVGKVTR
jgi:hypothetical protein